MAIEEGILQVQVEAPVEEVVEEEPLQEFKAIDIVLEYLYKQTDNEVSDFDNDMLAYGHLAMTCKTCANKFWNRDYQKQRLFRYMANFTHHVQTSFQRIFN